MAFKMKYKKGAFPFKTPLKEHKDKNETKKIVVGEGLKDRTGYIDEEGNRVIKGNDGSNLVIKEQDRRTHELDDMFIGGDHVFVNDTLVGGPQSWGMTEKWIQHHKDQGSKIYEGKDAKNKKN
jgi:hypothetical protein|tara:strand:- start:102 stop:470 length:369 start_codon:yes stop_codon:yes gene_type:complete